MNYCKNCIIPDTRPDQYLNDNGICNACNSYKLLEKIDWKNINVLFAALPEAVVEIQATITDLDKTSVVCEITATVQGEVCAMGNQVQRVLPSSTITRLIDEATSQ